MVKELKVNDSKLHHVYTGQGGGYNYFHLKLPPTSPAAKTRVIFLVFLVSPDGSSVQILHEYNFHWGILIKRQ